jgi:hypothetical protein
MKTCNHCKISKPFEDFHITGKNKNGTIKCKSRCKSCLSEISLKKYHGKSISEKKEYYKKNRSRYTSEQRFASDLQRRYNLSLAEFQQMKESQNCRCKICSNELIFGKANKSENNARIDHNHLTGKVRGLLCHKCNSMLGMANDNVMVLSKAIEYLKETQ